MIYQEIKVPKYRWMIYAFFDTTASDVDAVMGTLYDLNCDYETATRAYENLMEGKKNTGLCYSNYRYKASVVVISKTTSAKEFFNSFLHEMNHLQAHVSDVYHLDPMGEDASYFVGEVARSMYDKISHLFCNCCRKEKKGYEKKN